jgi:hypothetical protein
VVVEVLHTVIMSRAVCSAFESAGHPVDSRLAVVLGVAHIVYVDFPVFKWYFSQALGDNLGGVISARKVFGSKHKCRGQSACSFEVSPKGSATKRLP